ncbi:pyridoxine 5'-phosphate synthase [Kiritimatiella glycovorans]|uniref:Pyridoxine 5'-phosphate synthase n=1 Tax=Kiritimatiella glycovorans TaxID=1307763 RepID=A0A0G3ELS8_9BACT|nr:pyridoxine 5'-phosphate synthase [Kiritimatiella glycovorans]AKJ65119.1 Pyridoxine 5'-phosphate synthase [Kiritimatiella glycovorans]
MLRLGVNIDHVATLRNARGTPYPDPLEAARLCAAAGAHGVTMHLREDRRHIRDDDVFRVKEAAVLPLNLEMANTPEIVDIALKLQPAEVCLVPERREELTTEGGLDVIANRDRLEPTVRRLGEAGIEVSLFVEPDPEALDTAAALGAPVVELHTGAYCDAAESCKPALLDPLIRGAEYAHGLDLRVNAGHGIHTGVMEGILRIPHIDTLNIGHSIVCRAVMTGMEQAVREMLDSMNAHERRTP